MTFDVFGTRGRFERQVRMRCDAHPGYDESHMLGNDRAVIVTGGIDAFYGAMAGGAMGDDIESDVEMLELTGYSINRSENE